MSDAELRLACLKYALEYKPDGQSWRAVLGVAAVCADFVLDGKQPEPPADAAQS